MLYLLPILLFILIIPAALVFGFFQAPWWLGAMVLVVALGPAMAWVRRLQQLFEDDARAR